MGESEKCLLYKHFMKRRLSDTNLNSENNLPTFRLNAPVVIKAKVKRCERMLLFIYNFMHIFLVHQTVQQRCAVACAVAKSRLHQTI